MPAPEIKLARGKSSLNPNFPGNSESQPVDKPKFQPAVKNPIKKRKKSFLEKIKSTLMNGDDKGSVSDYILYDVLVPAIKNTIVDTVTTGIEMIFYGERRSRPNNIRRDGVRSYVPYGSFYGSETVKPTQTVQPRDRYAFEDIIFASRGEAEDILSQMNDAVDNYGLVSVADFYDLCGLNHEFTDQKYGWASLREAFTERIRDGYIIKLPRAKALN